jgi:8-oxo-dGTP diphosphatase
MPKSEQGVTADRYSIIPRTLIFIVRREAGQESVLLIKGAPIKRLWANQYNGIGGHVERGEDVLSSARRELKEETGLECGDLHLVGTVLIDAAEQRGIGLFVFRGDDSQGELVESHEGQLEWVSVDELGGYPLVEDLQTILPRVLSMRAGDAPFAARYFYNDKDELQIVFGK